MHSSVAHLPRGNRPRNPRIRVVSGRQALAFNYQYLNRLQEAANTLQQATARKLEIGDYLVERYDLSFLEADQAGMQREAALAHGKSGQENGSQAMKRLSRLILAACNRPEGCHIMRRTWRSKPASGIHY